MRAPVVLLLGLCWLLLGCGGHGPPQPISGAALVRIGDVAEGLTATVVDATLEQLLLSATSASGDPLFTDALARPGQPRSLPHPRLLVGGSIVRFVTVDNAGGAVAYPTLTGAISVATTASVIASWPTASNQQAQANATIAFDQGAVSWNDPVTGASATVAGGLLTLQLASTYSYSTTGSWTATIDAVVAPSPAYPIVVTAWSPMDGTHTVSSTGYRHVQLVETSTSGSGGTTLTIVRSVDGNGLPGQGPGGASGVDPAVPGQVFTTWTSTVDGTQVLVMDRATTRTLVWNLGVAPAVETVTIGQDLLVLNELGLPEGPTSAAELLAAESVAPLY